MNRNKTFSAFLLLLAFSIACFSQNPTVDSTFAPALSKIAGASLVHFVQPDGKIIIAGNFQVANGQIRFGIARLNTDGTTDLTFNCAECNTKIQIINNVITQPDGKILIAGRESVFVPYGKIIRVNADGSLDNSFNYPSSESPVYSAMTVKGVYPDGKILVLNRKNDSNGNTDTLFRLNADGSKDNSFAPFSVVVTASNNLSLNAKVLTDGRAFVFGNNSYGALALLNADGSRNNSFQSPALMDGGSPGVIVDIALQSDGKIAFVGRFTAVNGISRKNLARLNADQSVDTSFSPSDTVFTFTVMEAQIIALANGRVLIGSNSLNASLGRVLRINNNGSLDTSFTPPSIAVFSSMQIDSSERIYIYAHLTTNGIPYNRLLRYSPDGILDASFAPAVEPSAAVTALGLQADGKVLVGGTQEKANGISRKIVSRLNPDGTTDAGFDTNESFRGTINDFEVQPDGKILVAGAFFHQSSFKALVRLNSNGSLDAGFNASISGSYVVNDIVLQTDGKIVIAGNFTAVDGAARNSLARLNADGTLDTSFNVQIGTGATIYAVAVQADGKIMIGGNFSGVNGFNRTNIARLNSDGTLDTGFNASVGILVNLLLKPDGKYAALTSQTIYQLNPDGSPDSGFQSPTLSFSGSLTDLVVLNDNSIVVSGLFYSLNNIPFYRIARLKPDGSPDATSFRKGIESPASVFLKQPDGKLLAGGDFRLIDDVPRTGLARLSFATVIRATPFDFDGDGRADISVYRPSNTVWYQLLGANYQFVTRTLGESGAKIVPADYDGDGKTDYAIFRPAPDGNSARSEWVYITSRDNFPRSTRWGSAGDIPLPSDVNGDGTADFVVFRPSENNWYRSTTTGQVSVINFGSAGDKPLIGDFDGDGKADPAIYRPSTGAWWYAASSAGNAFRAVQWGIAEDVPAPADYDGDGKTDLAVFRPSNGGWYIFNSGTGTARVIQFGLSGDKPIAADYDGDGKADIAVFRPASGEWFLLRSSAGFTGLQWGTNNDIPIPNAFIP